jgi:repressor LexA
MKKLNNPQKAIYDFIVSYYEKNSFPPTVREICTAVGLASTSTVHAHLAKLEQKGLIQRNPAKQRSLVITEPQTGAAGVNVPLVGNVAAGTPILGVENIEDEFPFPPNFSYGAVRGGVLLKIEAAV